MFDPNVVNKGGKRAARAAVVTAISTCVTLMLAFTGVAGPSTAEAVQPPTATVDTSPAASVQQATATPRMCRPEPPDYPGCTAAQVRPLLRATFDKEYTGHAWGYRYYRMGQHARGVIFAHLLPRVNVKLARLYQEAVSRYEAAHTTVVVDDRGVRHVVVAVPHFPTWAAFRANTTALCNGNTVTVHFPTQYCWAITQLGHAGAVVTSLLNQTIKIVFSCDGFAIGGMASGTFTAWRMGTGLLEGGYYGGAAVEIGCQTTHLWNWVSGLW